MTWTTRLQMLGGILAVLVVGFGFTVLFNQRMMLANSLSATVTAPTFPIGSGYGGIVVEQNVAAGDPVKAGDVLFVVNSSSLQQAVSQGTTPDSNLAYDVDVRAGTVTYRSVTDGYLTDVDVSRGSFVPDGGVLASVVGPERAVEGYYRLSPVDYGRVDDGSQATIVLPNMQKLDAQVESVQVETEDGEAVAVIRLSSDALTDPGLAALTREGTPVTAQIALRDEGILAGPTASVLAFLTKIGLR